MGRRHKEYIFFQLNMRYTNAMNIWCSSKANTTPYQQN